MITDPWSVPSLTAQMLTSNLLRGPVLETAVELPRLFQQLVAATGRDEANTRFDAAIAAALATPYAA